MNASAVSPTAPSPVARARWELPVLGVLAVLSFVCVTITVASVPGGLPAHPLFVHVPVVLIPLTTLGALVLTARPRWLSGHAGTWIGLGAVVALGALDLTMNAGDALRQRLFGAAGGPAIVAHHAALAGQLRVLFIAFTAVYLVALAVHATAGGVSSGVAIGDRVFATIRRASWSSIVLRLLTAALAIACLVWVYRVGDAGARAVWAFRVHAAGVHPGPAGRP